MYGEGGLPVASRIASGYNPGWEQWRGGSDPPDREQAIMKAADRRSRGARFGIVVAAAISLAASLATAGGAENAPPQNEAGCELRIEGKFIRHLRLINRRGAPHEISNPGTRVWLPPGEYRLETVELEGGHRCAFDAAGGEDWFTLGPEKPYRLHVAPLAPKAKVTRKGRFLEFDCELVDTEGQVYSSRNRTDPPRLAIYKGDRQIHTGSFEYG